jgi:hypothetical protein
MVPRADPENWRASHERPASLSKRTPTIMPIARTNKNITTGLVARMDQALRMAQNVTVLYAGNLAARHRCRRDDHYCDADPECPLYPLV